MNLFILVMNVFILLAQNRDAYRLSKILNINNEKISEVSKVRNKEMVQSQKYSQGQSYQLSQTKDLG